MKNKVLIFTGLCALSLCTWETQASIPQQTFISLNKGDNHIPTTAEIIELLGTLNYSPGPDDIEAGATDDAVYIYFNRSHGNVNISLYNAAGALVYCTIVNTSTQQMVVIPITTVASGTYTVELSNASGYAVGDFNHN